MPRNYIHFEFRRHPLAGSRSRPQRSEANRADESEADLRTDPNCVFCQIVAGRSPARVRYLDNDIIVIVNRLVRDEPDPWWPPLMLLVMPKEHLSQIQMWDSGLLPRLGKIAVDMGAMYAPNGFRLVSNFGKDGEQTQGHGHLHVVGGVYLGHYLEHDVVYAANRRQ